MNNYIGNLLCLLNFLKLIKFTRSHSDLILGNFANIINYLIIKYVFYDT